MEVFADEHRSLVDQPGEEIFEAIIKRQIFLVLSGIRPRTDHGISADKDKKGVDN